MRHAFMTASRWCFAILISTAAVAASRAADVKPVEPGKVLVLPFTAANPSDAQAWIGKSVQQSLLADLTAESPGGATSSDTPAKDADDAIAVGKKAGAHY